MIEKHRILAHFWHSPPALRGRFRGSFYKSANALPLKSIRNKIPPPYSSIEIGTHSGFKVLVEEGTNRILGAHVLGEGAGEVINLFAVAIRIGIRASDLKQTLFAYPTHGSNLLYML